MSNNTTTLFQRMLQGGTFPNDDPQMSALWEQVTLTMQQSAALNASVSMEETRTHLSVITGKTIDSSTTVFIPFYTNFGKHTTLGKHVFINHACSFLDLGGITIEDYVQIGPRVNPLFLVGLVLNSSNSFFTLRCSNNNATYSFL